MTIHLSNAVWIASRFMTLTGLAAGWLGSLLTHRISRWIALAIGTVLLAALIRYPEPAAALWKVIHARAPIPVTLIPNNRSIPIYFL